MFSLSASCAMPVKPDFDQALFTISDCLTEARSARDQGEDRRARALYAAAERYAARTGFLELIRLVWAYDESLPPAAARELSTIAPFAHDEIMGKYTATPPD